MISVVQLGSIDYATGLSLQQRLVELRKQARIGDVLVLLEHAPVVTLGRNAKQKNLLASPELLAQRGVELFECDRGGDITFHGPGQLVGYPIFDLRGGLRESAARLSMSVPGASIDSESVSPPSSKPLGAVDYVRRLEEVLIRTCADFGIPAKRIPGLTGVWTEPQSMWGRAPSPVQVERSSTPGQALESKIAAIGVHISRGVTSHGFALNLSTDLTYFDLIVPCGITSKPVTSMSKELGQAPDAEKVTHSISRNFGQVFGSQILWLDSLNSLLGETVGVPMKIPDELRRLHKEDDIFSA